MKKADKRKACLGRLVLIVSLKKKKKQCKIIKFYLQNF